MPMPPALQTARTTVATHRSSHRRTNDRIFDAEQFSDLLDLRGLYSTLPLREVDNLRSEAEQIFGEGDRQSGVMPLPEKCRTDPPSRGGLRTFSGMPPARGCRPRSHLAAPAPCKC